MEKITWADCLEVMNFYYNSYEAIKKEFGENSTITKKYEKLFNTEIINVTLADVYDDLVDLTNDDRSQVKKICKEFITNWINQNK